MLATSRVQASEGDRERGLEKTGQIVWKGEREEDCAHGSTGVEHAGTPTDDERPSGRAGTKRVVHPDFNGGGDISKIEY